MGEEACLHALETVLQGLIKNHSFCCMPANLGISIPDLPETVREEFFCSFIHSLISSFHSFIHSSFTHHAATHFFFVHFFSCTFVHLLIRSYLFIIPIIHSLFIQSSFIQSSFIRSFNCSLVHSFMREGGAQN